MPKNPYVSAKNNDVFYDVIDNVMHSAFDTINDNVLVDVDNTVNNNVIKV